MKNSVRTILARINISLLAFVLAAVPAFAQGLATKVEGVGSSTSPTGGALSVNCVSGCSGGAGPGNVTIIGPLGSKVSASSVSVVVASDQAAIPITIGAALPAGTNTIGNVGIVNGANQAAVKAASTPPTATDPALVVVLSPNSSSSAAPVNVTVNSPPNDVLTGPITCTAACAATTQVNSQGAGSVGIVATGSGTGLSFTFQGSVDGTNWFNLPGYTPAATVVTAGTALTANGEWTIPASGWRLVRVNLASISGGSEVFNVNSSAGSVLPPGSPVTVNSGKITINSPPNDTTTGPTACTSTSTCTALTVSTQGSGSVGISLTGSGSGMAFTFQGSIDGTNWFAIGCLPPGLNPTPVSTGSANGDWFCPPAGYQLVRVDMTGFTSGTETITLNASAGSAQPVLGAVANAVEIDGANGAALSATNPIFDAQVPTTAGGLLVKSFIVANNTTSVAIKASAGQLYAISAYSISAATPVFLKLYNAAQGSTTCGSGTPVEREMIPATGATGSGIILPIESGFAFSTAITICVTAGIADADTTAPAASSYLVNAFYK